MNAANLITLIQASSEIAGLPTVSSSESQPADGFLLALQQYVQPELASLEQQPNSELAVTIGDGLAPPSLTAGDGTSAQPSSADGLLRALTECLAALLGKYGAAELPSDNSQDTSEALAAGSPQPAAPQAPAETVLTLLAGWRQLLADLAAVLGGSDAQVAVESSQPVLTSALGLSLSLPWSATAGQTDAAGRTMSLATAASGTQTPTGSILAGAAELAAAPASIKWFATAGVIGAGQPGTEAVQTAPPVLTSELTASDGSTVRLSLQAAQPQPATEQSMLQPAATQTYNVTVETTGGSSAALSAQLTINRLDAALPAITADGQAIAPNLTSTQPQPVPASPTPAAASQPQLTATPATAGLPIGGETEAVVNPSPSNPTVAVTAADRSFTATAKTAQPPAATAAELTAVSTSDGQPAAQALTADTQLRRMLGADQTPVRKSTPAVTAPAVSGGTGGTANAAAQPLASNGWTADQALVQLAPDSPDQALLARQPQRLEPQQLEPLPTASGLSTVELDLTAIQPQAAQLPAQLMEFVGTRFEIAPYQGLQYQQLLEQLFDKVEQARNAGNGLYNAHLDLNPPSLGKMFVNISVRGDAVAMQLAVAANVPKEQLKDSMDALRQSLEEAGLYVVELQIVEIEGDGERSGGRQQQEHSDEDSAARQEGSASRSTPVIEPAVKQTSPLSRGG